MSSPIPSTLIDSQTSLEARIKETHDLASHTLSAEELGHISLLLSGAYAPLQGFHSQEEYRAILSGSDEANFPIPLNIRVTPQQAETLKQGDQLVLRDEEGTPLATLNISSIFASDLDSEAEFLYGHRDPNHPGVARLLAAPSFCLGGRLEGIQHARYFDFTNERSRPQELEGNYSHALVADQILPTSSEAYIKELTSKESKLLLLIPASVLPNQKRLPYATRARLYRQVAERLGEHVTPVLVGIDAEYGSPRLTALMSLVAHNYGCQRIITTNPQNTAIAQAHGIVAHELNVSDDTCQAVMEKIEYGQDVSEDLLHPEDVTLLKTLHAPRSSQGICLFFTGLSGAGKSTVARALFGTLSEYDRKVTLLDGDVVRLNLSKGLGFSKEDRDTNILRIGFVASQITRNGGIAICAPIAPYQKTRRSVRHLIEAEHSRFVEVHVSTDLATCESRDPKGLYAKARAGQIKGFTGIDDPYEAPENPEIRLDTGKLAVHESVEACVSWLKERGYLT